MYVCVIFLVPDHCSITFKRLIEALFITHAETKLNTLGHLDGSVVNNSTDNNHTNHSSTAIINDRGHWCHNLVRRPTCAN
jgi:hypothetical protein